MFNWIPLISILCILGFIAYTWITLHFFFIKFNGSFVGVFLWLTSVFIPIGIIAGFGTAKADDLTLRYSVNAIGAPADVMGLSLGHTFDSGFLQYKLEGGFTNDRRVSNLTGFGLASVGIVPTAGNFFMSFHQGFALLTNPDGHYNSGVFQFAEDLGVGFRGTNNTAIVLGLRHLSNAGLMSENYGRDTLYIEVRIPQ
jgi:hypothetical protein